MAELLITIGNLFIIVGVTLGFFALLVLGIIAYLYYIQNKEKR